MLNKAIGFIARIAVGKQIVAAIAWAHNKSDGHRTEINLAVIALVHLLKIVGVIPDSVAGAIEASLAAILPVTLADKVAKAKATIDSILPAPANDKEAKP